MSQFHIGQISFKLLFFLNVTEEFVIESIVGLISLLKLFFFV